MVLSLSIHGDKNKKTITFKPHLYKERSTNFRFWILDFRLTAPTLGIQRVDFKLTILDLFRPQGAGLEPKNNPKSKIQNLKSKI
ncbi:hypothetical protein [Nostoc sp. ChiQUE01b]|uniref:hypothetical protein n=1 Tax=Nostoc sp. ChiQUE01b TaxID=3075376 RepID=UPI002AD4634B|nr:hypothetical protein [Nostoc sp. ChiQUE01b]MDZ8263025.1 hypothetical protein [Nostoc sp. ChiQUE01b]